MKRNLEAVNCLGTHPAGIRLKGRETCWCNDPAATRCCSQLGLPRCCSRRRPAGVGPGASLAAAAVVLSGRGSSGAVSPLLLRAQGQLVAAKGLPALLSFPTRDGGACTEWHSDVCHLTPLLVCFPGYCLHQDHNRYTTAADRSRGIKDT